MNRRKLFGLLGLGVAGTVAGLPVSKTSPAPDASGIPGPPGPTGAPGSLSRWDDMTPEEREIFYDNCHTAWMVAATKFSTASDGGLLATNLGLGGRTSA